jgi:hypothetical protein
VKFLANLMEITGAGGDVMALAIANEGGVEILSTES